MHVDTEGAELLIKGAHIITKSTLIDHFDGTLSRAVARLEDEVPLPIHIQRSVGAHVHIC